MIDLIKKYPNFDEGAYGTVFFTSDGRATKVFKQKNLHDPMHVTNVYKSEVKAYEIASARNEMAEFIPQFYGPVTIGKIFDEMGNDISSQYELNLAYQMKKIEGDFIKHDCTFEEIGELYRRNGICHLSDTSVVLGEEGKICYVIDFAVEEFVLEHPILLDINGA